MYERTKRRDLASAQLNLPRGEHFECVDHRVQEPDWVIEAVDDDSHPASELGVNQLGTVGEGDRMPLIAVSIDVPLSTSPVAVAPGATRRMTGAVR
jgi:glutamate formiminotransferase